MQRQARDRLEGFEILPTARADSPLSSTSPEPDAPLDTAHRWHVLMELVQDDGAAAGPCGELATELLEAAIGEGLLENATIASSEAQAEAFWKIRDSIAEAERAAGPALQHDISVPVDADGPLYRGRVAANRSCLSRHPHRRLWPSGRWQYPFPCQGTVGGVEVANGMQATARRSRRTSTTGARLWGIIVRRTWHRTGKNRRVCKACRTGPVWPRCAPSKPLSTRSVS